MDLLKGYGDGSSDSDDEPTTSLSLRSQESAAAAAASKKARVASTASALVRVDVAPDISTEVCTLKRSNSNHTHPIIRISSHRIVSYSSERIYRRIGIFPRQLQKRSHIMCHTKTLPNLLLGLRTLTRRGLLTKTL